MHYKREWDSPKEWESPKKCPTKHCDMARTIQVDCNRFEFPLGSLVLIPVVLAEVELQLLVESEICLPTAAKEIKNVRRNVYLTQCKAIPSVTSIGSCKVVKVFVSGIIQKNIQYVEECSGYLRDYSVDVPFSCNQAISVKSSDIELLSRKSTLTGERILIDEEGHGADLDNSGGITFEIYNEPIECRLLFSLVNDLDIHKNFDSKGRFKTIIEKAEVVLIFKLLQSQQVPYLPEKTKDSKEGNLTNSNQKPVQPQTLCSHEHIKSIIKRVNNFKS